MNPFRTSLRPLSRRFLQAFPPIIDFLPAPKLSFNTKFDWNQGQTKTMSERIIQITPAVAGWNAVLSKADGVEFLPVLCWALVEYKDDDLGQPTQNHKTVVLPMVQGDDEPVELCKSPRFFGVAAPHQTIEEWLPLGKRHHAET